MKEKGNTECFELDVSYAQALFVLDCRGHLETGQAAVGLCGLAFQTPVTRHRKISSINSHDFIWRLSALIGLWTCHYASVTRGVAQAFPPFLWWVVGFVV
jgi:hypothetical protein